MRWLFILFLSLFTLSAYADDLWIEPDVGVEPIINAINNAHQSIKLVMYGFTDQRILDALVRQKQKGRTVQIILEEKPYKTEDENKETIAAMNENHLDWHASLPPYRLVHQKTLIIDGKQAIVMTFNFTHSTFKKQRNFALVIDDAKEVNAIDALFTSDWNHKSNLTNETHLVVSPENSRTKMLDLIDSAKKSIAVYAQNVSDFKVIGALANAAKKGIQVRLITSTPLRAKQESYLTQAGVTIHYNKNYVIHAKVFIVDQREALLGSINLTRASLDDNRELSVLTADNAVVSQLVSTYSKDWDNQFVSANSNRDVMSAKAGTEKNIDRKLGANFRWQDTVYAMRELRSVMHELGLTKTKRHKRVAWKNAHRA